MNRDLERKHFGEHGANARYPSMRNDYPWDSHRPAVPDSRFPAKENVVIHGLEADAVKFESDGQKYKTSFHYQQAADYYNMAGDRRADLMKTLPQLVDKGHVDAVDYCYYKARDCQHKADLLGEDS